MRGLFKSFRYAFRGLGYQLACERNFRIHCFAVLTVLFFTRFYSFASAEWGLLILQFALVLGSESLNTAIEQTDNAVTRAKSTTIRHAKDCAAAGVLIFALCSLALAWILFWDIAAFGRIVAFFSVWYRMAGLLIWIGLMAFFIFCKKTYKKDL